MESEREEGRDGGGRREERSRRGRRTNGV